MNYSAYYSNVDIAVGVVLLAIVLMIIKLLIPLKSSHQDTPSRMYYGRCCKISHLKVRLKYYISKMNYEISQPSEKVVKPFLFSCFIVKYSFTTVHAIGDFFFKKDVRLQTTLC